MATVFPDVEKLLVAIINDGLSASSDPVASGVTVSVKKPDADTSPYPSKIVTVRSDGGNQMMRDITRMERIGVNVWANEYADASSLAGLVDAILRQGASGSVKLVESVLSPTRIANEGTQEQRYMTFEVVVKAHDI